MSHPFRVACLSRLHLSRNSRQRSVQRGSLHLPLAVFDFACRVSDAPKQRTRPAAQRHRRRQRNVSFSLHLWKRLLAWPTRRASTGFPESNQQRIVSALYLMSSTPVQCGVLNPETCSTGTGLEQADRLGGKQDCRRCKVQESERLAARTGIRRSLARPPSAPKGRPALLLAPAPSHPLSSCNPPAASPCPTILAACLPVYQQPTSLLTADCSLISFSLLAAAVLRHADAQNPQRGSQSEPCRNHL
ncbi:hypothetical protein BD289DRAFT_109950 [Coniella lustricola]|uniref:Uncharacterized protein n=1 Tax=Coniella lustricola TaxID=2025994 RepID=A0A2T2ZXD9_9PEZI|nr:hypothetical protein BD289DRAFT_109950 [Coniella lustricola]